MTKSTATRFALLAALALASDCSQLVGPNTSRLPQGRQIGAGAGQTVTGRLLGPGLIVTGKLGGPIFGWSIDENGTDALLTEVSSIGAPYTSAVETFNQATGQTVKFVRKQKSGPGGDRELLVDAIQANDVALIDDERRNPIKRTVRDVYYVMAPVTNNKITGTWTRPPGKYFGIYDIADQQVDPDSVMAVTVIDNGISKPPTFELVVTDIAANKILRVLHAPKLDGVNYPYLVSEDTATHHAYVPAANYRSETVFIDFNVLTGHTSNDFVAPPFSGPVTGIAIDSATHTMCTTTQQNYSIEIYNLTTKKQTFIGRIPNAAGELQAPTLIAADSINHLFLVQQPQSLLGGSEIYVYDEQGNVLESLSGFDFGDRSGIQVAASSRSGYVYGPGANHLQSLTY